MALASLPARKRARRMVPQARRHLGWTHAADRHRGHGTQAAHRALALCRNGGTSRRCRNPPRERSSRIKEQELSVAILPTTIRGNATVLFFGAITPPRFRWVASRRGYASCMRHSGAGSPNGPTECKVDAAVAARQAALDPITYRYVTTHNRRKRCRRPFDKMRVGQKNKLTYRWARKGSRPRAAHDQRTNRLICLVGSVPNVEPAPPSCCRLATAKPCQLHLDENQSRPRSARHYPP